MQGLLDAHLGQVARTRSGGGEDQGWRHKETSMCPGCTPFFLRVVTSNGQINELFHKDQEDERGVVGPVAFCNEYDPI